MLEVLKVPSLAGPPPAQGKGYPQTGAGRCVHLDFSTPLLWVLQSWQRWLEPEGSPIYFQINEIPISCMEFIPTKHLAPQPWFPGLRG